MIIDSHHHIWDPAAVSYELFANVPELDREFSLEQFERAAVPSGVGASVCVEAASAGADGRAETAWLAHQTRLSEVVEGLVIWAPLERPDLSEYLAWARSMKSKPIVGVRRSFEFEASDFARLESVRRGVALAGELGLTVDLVLFARSLPAVVDLVAASPEVQFVVDHLAKPPIRTGETKAWSEQFGRLAEFPNVVCKVSGLITEAGPGWTRAALMPFLEHARSVFGWDRLLFGSDWPVSALTADYDVWVKEMAAFTRDCTSSQREQFYERNARRVYRLA